MWKNGRRDWCAEAKCRKAGCAHSCKTCKGILKEKGPGKANQCIGFLYRDESKMKYANCVCNKGAERVKKTGGCDGFGGKKDWFREDYWKSQEKAARRRTWSVPS